MSAAATVVWFRLDLRLADNPALDAALARGGPVVPLFVWAPEEEAPWPPGAASRWWLHHSLAALDADLRTRGSRLVVARGPTRAALERVLAATEVGAVVFAERVEPAIRARDDRVAAALRRRGIVVQRVGGATLLPPDAVRTGGGTAYRVFTPFWSACLAAPPPGEPLLAPRRLPAPAAWPASLPLEALGLRPRQPWAAGLATAWRPGEAGAARRLAATLETVVPAYAATRDRPDTGGTSRLSPHLHFGEVSARAVWHAVEAVAAHARARDARASGAAFLRQLGWREFAHHLLVHFPATTDAPLRAEFARFPWARSPAASQAWRRGGTGYPMVDAGMRELRATGWMHNRARMVAASFLVKDLLLSWREGARWFWETLVDADLANNTLGWQWVAGCGADAAPYFRIFNPALQGARFDPRAAYVGRWVPELAGLAPGWAHRPWAAPPETLAAAGVRLGRTYPRPLVDHGEARERALAALASLRETERPRARRGAS